MGAEDKGPVDHRWDIRPQNLRRNIVQLKPGSPGTHRLSASISDQAGYLVTTL